MKVSHRVTIAAMSAVSLAVLTWGQISNAQSGLNDADPVLGYDGKGISKDYLRAIEFLQQQGMESPQGRTLRKVVVEAIAQATVPPWQMTTVGWVSADKKSVLLRNGCSYPLIKDLGEAELKDLQPAGMEQFSSPFNSPTQSIAAVVGQLLLVGERDAAEKMAANASLSGSAVVTTYIRSHLQFAEQMAAAKKNKEALKALIPIRKAEKGAAPYLVQNELLSKCFVTANILHADLMSQEGKSSLASEGEVKAAIEELKTATEYVDNGRLVTFNNHPAMAKLAALGTSAVPDLLSALDQDNGLTRLGIANIAIQPENGFISVNQMLELTLTQMLKIGALPRDADGKLLKDQIMAVAEAAAKESSAAGWIKILSDDKVSIETWSGTATQISRALSPRPSAAGPSVVMDAESKSKLGKVLAQRLSEMMRQHDYLMSAQELAIALARVDGMTYKSQLSDVTDKAMEALTYSKTQTNRRQNLLARLIAARYEMGDADSKSDFSTFIGLKTTDINIQALVPLWAARNDASWSDVRRRVLLSDASPYSVRDIVLDNSAIFTAMIGRMMEVPEFVEGIAALLKDQTVIGELSLIEHQRADKPSFTVRYQRTGKGGGARSLTGADADLAQAAVKVGQKEATMRLCDYVAIYLDRIKDRPGYVATWPKEKRDKALTEIAAFLQANKTNMTPYMLESIGWPD